jgi:hypothetical protein
MNRNKAIDNMIILNDPKYSDLDFKIEEKHIYVQKCILENNSKYFESKFTKGVKSKKILSLVKNFLIILMLLLI